MTSHHIRHLELHKAAADLASKAPCTYEQALDALTSVLSGEVQALVLEEVLIPPKWWERPRWLWRRVIRRRLVRQLLDDGPEL